MQIDVTGDSIIGETPTSDPDETNLGDNPTNVAVLPDNARVFVTSAGSLLSGGIDMISSFTPASQSTIATGLGPVTNTILPPGSLPVFANTVQNGFIYFANYGTNSVSALNTATNVVVNTAPVGVNPVALAEANIPNNYKLYVANQSSNSVSSLNAIDLSANVVTGFSGIAPVWVVARSDGQKVYVLTEGDGQLITMDTATDTVSGSLAVGAGANFIFYDPHLNRLYVTNPVTGVVYVFSDTGGAGDTPVQLAAISFATGSAPCPKGCTPASVTALPDGSRFYVASYQVASSCPDSFVGAASACVIPGLTVFNANNFSLQYPAAPTLTLLTDPPFLANLSTNQYQYAVPPVASCAATALFPALYSPSVNRFRVFTVASVDSSRVYVSMCDAGAIAVINTTGNNINNPLGGTPPDTVVTDLLAAFSGPSQTGGEPPPQNPIFLITGQ
jgi:YVTN family beta-propeller protein